MAIVQDWKIRSRSHHCFHSEEPFEDGEEFYTCIFADPDSDGYLRRDYAAKNWPEVSETLDPPPFSLWKSVYELPEAEEKVEAIEHESAEAMLRRMIDEDDPTTENARYILAVMLERKKTLRPVDEKETDSGKLIFYEHKVTGDVFIVADPQLHLNDLGKVQEEVTALLGGGSEKSSESPEGEAVEASGGASGNENSDSKSEEVLVDSRENPENPETMSSQDSPPSRWLHSLKQPIDELIVQLRLGRAEAIDYVESHKSELREQLDRIRASLGDGEKHAALRTRLDELRVQLALGRMESRDNYVEQREKISQAMREARGEWHDLEDSLKGDLEAKSESLETKLNALALDLGLATAVAEDELKTRKEEIALQAQRLADKVKAAGSDTADQAEEVAHEAKEAWNDLKDNLSRLFR